MATIRRVNAIESKSATSPVRRKQTTDAGVESVNGTTSGVGTLRPSKTVESKRMKNATVVEAEVFQVRNSNTGHWIMKDASGKFVVNKVNKPFEGVKIIQKIPPGRDPCVTKEIALLAEKAVVEVLNKRR